MKKYSCALFCHFFFFLSFVTLDSSWFFMIYCVFLCYEARFLVLVQLAVKSKRLFSFCFHFETAVLLFCMSTAEFLLVW